MPRRWRRPPPPWSVPSRARAGEPAGTVRLTASEFIGVEVLPAILTAFRETNPGIVIELVLSNENQDLSRRDADIAVRMARPTQAALVAKRLGDVSIGLYAHRDYAARHGLPASLDALSRHPIIGFDADPVALRSSRSGGLPVSRETFALRSDSEHARMAALRSGFGIGACQREVARREPGLIAVLPQEIRFTLEMWLVMHEDLRGLRRVRLLYDHLATALGAYARSALAEPRPKKRGKTASESRVRRGRQRRAPVLYPPTLGRTGELQCRFRKCRGVEQPGSSSGS